MIRTRSAFPQVLHVQLLVFSRPTQHVSYSQPPDAATAELWRTPLAVVLTSSATGLVGPSGASVVSDRLDARFSGVQLVGTFGSLRKHGRTQKLRDKAWAAHGSSHCVWSAQLVTRQGMTRKIPARSRHLLRTAQ